MVFWIFLAVLLTLSPVAFAKDHVVTTGTSIQKTINEANPGDTIRVQPGVYNESLHIDKADIKLIGIIKNGKWPTLEGSGKLNDGVIATGNGFTIENFKIQHYRANGVTTQGSHQVSIRRIIVEDTGIYGIYPTHGKNILVEDTVTSGIADAGIYIGICENVDVRRNEVFHNVAGIEVENSEHVLVEDNNVHDNTGGILVFVLPGLPRKSGVDTVVRNNHVFDNNYRNFADAGAVVAKVPPGAGIIVLAADKVHISNNIIRNNQFGGIILADLGSMPNLAKDSAVDPNPDDITIANNMYLGNGQKDFWFYITWMRFLAMNLMGGDVDGADSIIPPGADILGTHKGARICIAESEGVTTVDLPATTSCSPEQAKTTAANSFLSSKQETTVTAAADEGKHWFNVICAGCHARDYRLIGPPIKEIQKKYKSDANAVSAFAEKPKKIRSSYPDMPSQGHLGHDRLMKVAEYMLGL